MELEDILLLLRGEAGMKKWEADVEKQLQDLTGNPISYVGEGSQWIAYRAYPPDRERYIIKVNKNQDESRVDNSIENYHAVKRSGMKTLSFARKSSLFRYAYECEDLNPEGENVIYISPNTVRYYPKEKHILYPILKNVSEFKIKDYEKNIDELLKHVQIAGVGKNGSGITEDAIFIGVILNEDLTISLTYKIADFDTICPADEECNDFSGLNRRSMLTTLLEFFAFCVDADEYKADIDNRWEKEKKEC